MPLLDPYYATRRRLKGGLVVAGAVAGMAFGVLLTRLGKLVSGAPDATFENYAWNAAVFGILAGVVSPIVSWAVLRRVPLWRTIIEPLAWAVAGGSVAVIAGVPSMILWLPPVGLMVGFANLHRRFPDPVTRTTTQQANKRLQSAEREEVAVRRLNGADSPRD